MQLFCSGLIIFIVKNDFTIDVGLRVQRSIFLLGGMARDMIKQYAFRTNII
jgi:hypothetical protein